MWSSPSVTIEAHCCHSSIVGAWSYLKYSCVHCPVQYEGMFNVAVLEGKRFCYNFCQCYYSSNALSLYIKCMEVYLLQRCLCYDLLLAYVLHFVCTYASYAHFSFVSCLGTIYCNFLSYLFLCRTGASDILVCTG